MPAESISYSFQGLEGKPASCQISIYRRSNFDVVIVENSEEKDETLAIKKITAIANGVTNDYDLDYQRTTWLSCTPQPIDLLGEFRKIPLKWQPQDGFTLPPPGTPWAYLSRAEVEGMIGEALDL